MASDTATIRALMVGIDDYKGNNLNGCVRDIRITQKILQENLNVPTDNIRTLISPFLKPNEPEIDLKDLPTKINVLNALQSISDASKPGDFIYIHYSGHGARTKTKFRATKGEDAWDEHICTLDEWISDVEFGQRLDALADKDLVVFVVLDSCHSGGATRNNDTTKARCLVDESIEPPTDGAPGPGSRSAGERKAIVKNTWFNTSGKYNFIAACQPHEYAHETRLADGEIGGILTYHLVESLKFYNASKNPVTYKELMSTLQADLKATQYANDQQPMHLGDGKRVVFGNKDINDAVFSLSTNVVTVNDTSVTFKDGNATRINVGDKFLIYDPSHASMGLILPGAGPVAEVRIDTAGELQSSATLLTGSLANVKVGWLARLSQRAHTATVYVDIQNHEAEILRHIRTASVEKANALAPLEWTYHPNAGETPPNYSISVNANENFDIRDENNQILSRLPIVKADESGSRTLIYLLQHLSMYRAVMDLRPSTVKVPPKFDLTFTSIGIQAAGFDESEVARVQSAWEIKFTNTDTKELYVTILDLGPAYGIEQTFPDGDAASVMVGPGDHISTTIGITIPDLLKDAAKKPGFRMEDVYKVFITDKQASFSHFTLPDLEDLRDLGSAKRKTVKASPKKAPWYVAEYIVRTPLE
ncbi:hypothetical protein COL5a_008185 [Colletotrichum fioriniae]|uniref:uncharacterized protein n=1 Tax=Colletotrichum fioriniae TaxID=710243 RepID=UPI0023018F20|nr:uncharacterized protein COL516b_003832 [Colletotrichum fioriniae]KAJ0307861.1 hypothetical protein COL516b_003832 [Colletotrichum fioriniae]KAJ0323822.1 hypothetical protein COL5a_008185 [Colletotrichum fioriniae]KAJ3943387.1 hypothetical protein N0V96_006311 [Colletotrichum fioriniae]